MRRARTAMTMIIALAMTTTATAWADVGENTEADFEVTYLAAPAVAGLLLEQAGIDNRYGTGKTGGNYIRDVAEKMGPGTDFHGVSKTDVGAYECAVAAELNGLNAGVTASGTGVLDTATSGATAVDNADGTVTLTITAVDACGDDMADLDPLSDFSVSDSVIGGRHLFGTTAIPGSTSWDNDGGTYTVVLERNFFDSRPAGYTDGWHRVWDISIQDQVVEDDLVLQTTYSAVGDWKMDLYGHSDAPHPRFVVLETQTDGDLVGFFGVGYDPEGASTGTIIGTIDGQTITMFYERPASFDYTATFHGTITSDGDSMSGTWTDSGSISDRPWSMTRQ